MLKWLNTTLVQWIPVEKDFISCSMTCLAKWNIRLINFGPPGERNKDATTLGKAFPYSAWRDTRIWLWSALLLNKTVLNLTTQMLYPYRYIAEPSEGHLPKFSICLTVQDRPTIPVRFENNTHMSEGGGKHQYFSTTETNRKIHVILPE